MVKLKLKHYQMLLHVSMISFLQENANFLKYFYYYLSHK